MSAEPVWMRAASALANRLLAMDDQAEDILGEVGTCTLGVSVQGPEVRMLVFIDGAAVRVSRWPEDLVPDVCVEGPPASLLAMLRDGADAIGADDVKVYGDAKLAQRLQLALSRLELDVEEWLSRYVGDIAAHQL